MEQKVAALKAAGYTFTSGRVKLKRTVRKRMWAERNGNRVGGYYKTWAVLIQDMYEDLCAA